MPSKKEKKPTNKIEDEKTKETNSDTGLFFMDSINEPVLNNDGDQNEEKRESLLVLATLGMTKEYLGQEIGV